MLTKMNMENKEKEVVEEVLPKIKDEKKQSGFKFFSIFFPIIFSIIFGSIFGFMSGFLSSEIEKKINFFSENNSGNKSEILDQKAREVIREKVFQEDLIITEMVEKTSSSVVSIVVSKDVPIFKRSTDPFGNFFFNPFEDFFNQNNRESVGTEKRKVGGGTGFIISSDGMIATNKHVVSDQNADYTVVTNDGKEYSAKVLAREPIKDLAVIKIEGTDFPVLKLGNSDELKIGQTVIAIGNSLAEFSNSVSKGIISGLKRSLVAGSGFGQSEKLNDIIQTDAAINPGNSGGPLLNINGEVIGINVAVAQGAENIGFAIPINQAKKMIDQVEKTGKISVPFLGVRYLPIDEKIKKENNLDFDYGVIVSRGEKMTDFAVVPGSPADKAGIVENDIILEINGEKIDEKNSLAEIIAGFNVGDVVTFKIWHKGDIKNVKATLEERK